MKTTLKQCYIHLNRNFLDSLGNIKINHLSEVERKNLEYFSSSEVSNGTNCKLRKKEKLKYLDDSRYSCEETSQSEFTEDDSSSNNKETASKSVRKKSKHKLSRTEEPKKLDCLYCDKSFSNHLSFLIHKRSHQSKQFKCILCRTSWKYRQSFIYHMKRNHPEGEPFLCEYRRCGRSFKTQKLLEMHSKMHLKYMCRFCKKLFARKYRMRMHVLKLH